jgi:putative ABC transport system permease protein
MSMLGNYFKVALRNLLRHKIYSVINIVGLAVGLACCLNIALWVQYHLSFDRFHEKGDRICKLINIQKFSGRSSQHVGLTPPPVGPGMHNDYPEIADFCRIMQGGRLTVGDKDEPLYVESVFYADSTIFDIFTFEAVAGDLKSALSEPNSLVLTEETAKKISADRSPVGQFLKTKDGDQYKITAVVKKYPQNSHFQFDALISFSTCKGGWLNNFNNNTLCTYLLLGKGADRQALEAKFPGFLRKHNSLRIDNYVYYLQPLRDIHLYSTNINYQMNWNQTDIGYVRIFSAVAVLILIIACINFMNLATARSAKRAKEVGLRKVLGAGRSQLIKQFIGESVFLSLCAMLLALALIELTSPLLKTYFGNVFNFDYSNNWMIFLELAGIALIAGVLSGIYPAFFLSSFKPVTVLKGALQSGSKGLRLRRAFIVLQFAISIVLIIYTFFVVEQINYMRNRNMGFDKNQVVILSMNGDMLSKFETLRQELLSNPSITGVTASNCSLGDLLNENVIDYEGAVPGENWNVPNMVVDYDFIPFYGLEMSAGRNFSREFVSDTNLTFIANESLVKKLGWTPESAVGKRFSLDGSGGTVIGVLKDFNFYSLHHKIEPLILVYHPRALYVVSVRIRPENVTGSLQFLKSVWSRYSPSDPFSYSFLDEDFALKYESEIMAGRMTGAFSGLAVFIACLGLLGLISYTAERRTKEIGIRKVLGASVTDILLLLSREFLVLLSISMLIAWPVAWYAMHRWLQNFAYRIELEWYVFVLAGLISLAVTTVIVSFQAVRAATADPVKSLRYE